MNFRRVMLVGLPLLGAVFLFMVLRFVYRQWEASLLGEPRMPRHGSLEMPGGQEKQEIGDEGTAHEISDNVDLLRKDSSGRLQMRFRADRVIHKTKKTADITRPQIQYFTSDGNIITLTAQHGRAVTKKTLLNVEDVESGILWGNVVVCHDRGTPDDFTDDVLVETEDLRFNNRTYQLWTEGPVVLAGPEMDLTARRMRIDLDRQTRRVAKITFFEDILITMEAGDRLQMGLVGPAEEAPAEIPPDQRRAERPAPVPAPSRRAEPAPSPPPAPAVPGEVPGLAAPEATPPPEPQAPEDTGRDLWRIDLAGNVEARQLAQRLLCDSLTLYNETARQARTREAETPPDAGLAAEGRPVETPSAGTAVRRAPAQIAPPRAGPAARPDRAQTDRSGTSGAEGAAAEPDWMSPDAPPPLVVFADGPLIMTPISQAEQETLGDGRYEVTAIGKPAVVEDGPTRVTGAEVHYNMKRLTGSVIGKDSPITLDQPGRLHLTGGRLDFNRRLATADVHGEGRLQAQQVNEMLTVGGTAEGAGPESSALDAVWKRRMRLEFYRVPGGEEGGRDEVRRAEFHGDAVVKHKDSLLKGDALAVDFFPALEGRGQDIRRLVGRGDVFVRDTRAAEPDGSDAAGGDITCQDLDMVFERDKNGETQPKGLKARGKVVINDPKGTVRAEDVTARFARSAEGGSRIEFFDAYGDVLIDRDDLHAEGDHVKRDIAAGVLLLEGEPARARRGDSRIVGPRIEFLQAVGRATVRGAGELEVPATTDLRGRPRSSPEPLLITWKRGMFFEDRRNFAQFDGGVTATTPGSRLDSEKLWVYFKDVPQEKAADSTPSEKAPGNGEPSADLSGVGRFFENKAVVRVFAEKDVRAVEQRLASDGSITSRMEILGDNLTYLDEKQKAYMRGPGRLYILTRERAADPDAEAPGLDPDSFRGAWTGPVPRGHSRTTVAWAESMAYDGASDRAYFKGDIQAVHIGRGTPGEAGSPRRRRTTTRIRSRDFLVVFSERKPSTPAARDASTAPRDRMTIDKLIADQGVRLWVDDRLGSGRRLTYDRRSDLMHLLGGPDGWARMWREDEAEQEFADVEAREIIYSPATGRVRLVSPKEVILGQP